MRHGLGLLIVSALTFSACSSTTRRAAVEAPPAYQPTPEPVSVRMPVVLAPKLAEVQDAVRRVFKDAAVVNPNYNPNFLAGDFNGDSSQDIAVILKPSKLDELNQEYPPWLLRDPRINRSERVPLRIEKDDVLLAVIHGYGSNDWRDPEATQTFVLKNVVGNNLKVQTGEEFVTANSGKRLPRPKGDLIGETLQGTPGYIYYEASSYAWYDPKTFKPEELPGMFHRPRPAK